MAKAVKVICDRCECKIVVGSSFCESCGYPTRWASHEERTTWEVAQWKTADRSHTPKPPKSESGARRWNPFARKQDTKPALTLVPPATRREARSEPASAVVAIAEEAAPATATPEPPRVSIPPAAKQAKPIGRMKAAPSVAPGPRDTDRLTDEPATVLAMRMLNARVAELDARVQQLERELEATRAISHTP